MKIYANRFFSIIIIFVLLLNISYSQDYKILKSDETQLILEFDFNNKFEVKELVINGIKFTNVLDSNYPLQKPGNPFLPTRMYEIGIPIGKNAFVSIQEIEREVYNDKFVLATPDSSDQPLDKLNYNAEVYGTNVFFPFDAAIINSQAIFRYIKTASLSVSPFQFNAVERTLILNKRIILRVEFKEDAAFNELVIPVTDRMTEELIKTNLINPKEALTFLGKIESVSDSPQTNYWYNPNKNYYKVYLNEKGVYRITYDQLINLGISPSSGIQDGRLEIYNDEQKIPIDIIDSNEDGYFNSGDYFQFIGLKVKPSPYSGLNIYNKANLYWFSYQADSVYSYKIKNGYPNNFNNIIISSLETIHWEEDKLYDHFGYAPNDQRDYWNWQSVEVRGGRPFSFFNEYFKDSIAYSRDISKKQG